MCWLTRYIIVNCWWDNSYATTRGNVTKCGQRNREYPIKYANGSVVLYFVFFYHFCGDLCIVSTQMFQGYIIGTGAITWLLRCEWSNPEYSLQWRHKEHDGVSNHKRIHCLLNCWFRRRSKKTSKLRVTGLCAGNSLVTGEFYAQRTSNAESVCIWWRHHVRVNSTSTQLQKSRQSTNAVFNSLYVFSFCGMQLLWIAFIPDWMWWNIASSKNFMVGAWTNS